VHVSTLKSARPRQQEEERHVLQVSGLPEQREGLQYKHHKYQFVNIDSTGNLIWLLIRKILTGKEWEILG